MTASFASVESCEELENALHSAIRDLASLAKSGGSGVRPVVSRSASLDTPTDEVLAALARRLYADRRKRAQFFPRSFCAEPTWDIILDLFVARAEGKVISVTSACLAACVPSTTGLRSLHLLEDSHMVLRVPHPNDGRSAEIRLTNLGYERTREYLRYLLQSGGALP